MSSNTVIIENTPDGNIFVSGNTYPIRQALKQEGAKWEPPLKAWKFIGKKEKDIRKLIKDNTLDEIISRKKDYSDQEKQKESEESTMEFVLVNSLPPSKKHKSIKSKKR